MKIEKLELACRTLRWQCHMWSLCPHSTKGEPPPRWGNHPGSHHQNSKLVILLKGRKLANGLSIVVYSLGEERPYGWSNREWSTRRRRQNQNWCGIYPLSIDRPPVAMSLPTSLVLVLCFPLIRCFQEKVSSNPLSWSSNSVNLSLVVSTMFRVEL